MRPFSSLYFIRENKQKCILLMLMIMLGYGVYLGGLFVTNPYDNWEVIFPLYDKIVIVEPASDDVSLSNFMAFRKELDESGQVTLLEMGKDNGFGWKTVMGFESGRANITFRSVEDFRIYCRYMGISCDFSKLGNGSMVMGDRFAKNRSLEAGDKVDENFDKRIKGEYTLDALTDEEGYVVYFIDEEPADTPGFIALGNGIDGEELYRLAYSVQKNYKVSMYDIIRTSIRGQFRAFHIIYLFLVMLLSVILSVTINAVFVGMYQRRNFEFAVYRAIGISKARITGKIVGELFWIEVSALVLGGGVFFLGLYLLNNMVLYPAGMYLRYYHPMALLGLCVCNMLVFVPLVVSRCRQMLRADICAY